MLSIMDGAGVIERSRKIAKGYAEKAYKAVEWLKCPFPKESFRKMIEFIVERDK